MVLLRRYEANGIFGPPICLQWEKDAIVELNNCYVEKESVLATLPERDVRNLIEVMRVDPYYGPIVDTGLVTVVNRTHHDLATELLGNETPTRIIICVHGGLKDNGVGVERGILMPSDYVDVVSMTLAPEERERFHYVGMSEDNLCFDRGHTFGVGAQISDFHLVVWFTDNGNRSDIMRTEYNIVTITNGVMFELTMDDTGLPRTKDLDQCGDGIRQVTEYCDFAGGYPGCSFNCTVNPGYDCGIAKLEMSKCWMEVCGDGLKTRGEGCDDGNSALEDGCDECTVVDDYVCSNVYNMTSQCSQPASKVVNIPADEKDSKLTVDFRPAPLASVESGGLLRTGNSAVSKGSRLSSALTLFVVLLSTSLLR